ncbi:hypothetical protein K2Y00_02710 [Patescibacteria group bacterium]|nr:hypothetical protein [Patescibacteria group bacterium]
MKNQSKTVVERLLSFGLSLKEANVYIALLELGRSTVSKVSREANINRTTGYDVLSSLAGKGLVSISGKEPRQEYVAESPTSLLALLDKRLKETQDDIDKARSLVPELTALHRVGSRPQIRFYEGIEGLKQVYEDTLTATMPIYAYAAYEDMHGTLGDYFPKYYERRAEKGILARGIVPETPLTLERMKKNKEEMREAAVIPKDKFDISPDIEIYDNKVMIASWREKLGIIIESAEIAHAMKKIYELAWEEAKRLDVQNSQKDTNKKPAA